MSTLSIWPNIALSFFSNAHFFILLSALSVTQVYRLSSFSCCRFCEKPQNMHLSCGNKLHDFPDDEHLACVLEVFSLSQTPSCMTERTFHIFVMFVKF